MNNLSRKQLFLLNRLYRLTVASGKGYRVAAENIRNRGLKLLLKSFAAERELFAAGLAEQIKTFDGTIPATDSVRGMLHRGWINIKGSLTIGQESTAHIVLKECLRGDKIAHRQLVQAAVQPWPDDVAALLLTIEQKVAANLGMVHALYGENGRRQVIRLFNDEQIAAKAKTALTEAGFTAETIGQLSFEQMIQTIPQHKQEHAVLESSLAGAVCGMLFASVIAVATVWSFSEWLWVALFAALCIGALFGAILGALIGQAVSEEDDFIYDQALLQGNLFLSLTTDDNVADEAAQIMYQINAAARAGAR